MLFLVKNKFKCGVQQHREFLSSRMHISQHPKCQQHHPKLQTNKWIGNVILALSSISSCFLYFQTSSLEMIYSSILEDKSLTSLGSMYESINFTNYQICQHKRCNRTYTDHSIRKEADHKTNSEVNLFLHPFLLPPLPPYNESKNKSDETKIFIKAFLHAKQTVSAGTKAVIHPYEHPQQYLYFQRCLKNFTPLSDLNVYQVYQHLLTPRKQAAVAEFFWKHQHGKLWIQHARKAGGTTLCMLLRLNTFGLIHTRQGQFHMPPRETCQIKQFCIDCDLTQAHQFTGTWQPMPRLVDCVMNANQQNFIFKASQALY